MTVCGTKCAPICSLRVAVCIFNQIKDILHIIVKCVGARLKRNGINIFIKIVNWFDVELVYAFCALCNRVAVLFVKTALVYKIICKLLVGHIDFVVCVGDKLLVLFALICNACTHNRNGSSRQILAKLKILVIAHWIWIVIRVFVAWINAWWLASLWNIAYCVLPSHHTVNASAADACRTREANKWRFKIFYCVNHIVS